MGEKKQKFYQKNRTERLAELVAKNILSEDTAEILKNNLPLSDEVADNMIENQIGQFHLPVGVALNFLVNGKEYIVPMATEEPSVVAACSNGAKIIRQAGGFTATMTERLMIGQIILQDITDFEKVIEIVKAHEEEIFEVAANAHPSILKRGGGLKKIETRVIQNEANQPEFVSVYLSVDVQEAMGANILNTILEAVGEKIKEWTSADVLMQILSNYATESLVTATCEIPAVYFMTKQASGAEVVQKIAQAARYAKLDPYRAATHNKGIMNGIDAVILATGNDTRGVEAGAHAYASRDGKYRGLSNWYVNEQGNLVGELTMPMAVGTVGGAISVLPLAKIYQEMLQVDSAKELAQVIVSVGLAQNLSAIRALVTEGIQKGHMSLQAKSLAMSVGARDDEIDGVVAALKQAKHMNVATAEEILQNLRKLK